MLTESDRKVTQELQRRIAAVTPILDLRVFGSRARNEFTAESDLDIFIELEGLTPELREQISDIAWEVGFEMDRVITTIVATREQLQTGPMGASPLVQEIERDGLRP